MPQQPEIEVALQFQFRQDPKPYCTHRPIQIDMPCYDCSSLQIASLRYMCQEAGVPSIVPPNVSNTVDMWKWGKSIGGLVSVQKGVRTRGAIMLKGRWYGYGALGHTGMSCGDGTEFAAHGYRSGISQSNIWGGRNYQDALIIPGVYYADLQPPVDPAVLAALKKLLEWQQRVDANPLHLGDHNGDVTILNQLLVKRALLSPKAPMNTYTKQTRDAVVHFKKLEKLSNTVGHTFGGEAAAAILKP